MSPFDAYHQLLNIVKRLHKFIITSFLGPFVLTFFIVVFLLLMQFLWKYIDDLAGKGLQLGVLSKLMLYTSASLVPMAVPLAVLLASLMTMGDLGENFELIALKSSGISLQRIVYPLIIFCFILSILAFLFANYILPFTNLKMTALIVDITHKKPELQIKEGIFYNGIEGYSIRIGKKNYSTNLLRQIKIYDHTKNNGNTDVTVADSGYIKMTADKQFLLVTLYNGYNYSEIYDNQHNNYRYRTYPFRRDHFTKEELRIKLIGFDLIHTDENLYRQSYKMLSLHQLNLVTDSMQTEINQKSTNLYKTIVNNHMFRYKPLVNKKLNLPDSVKNKPVKKQNFDSIFQTLPLSDQSTLINEALSISRDAKTYIMSNNVVNDATDKRMRRYEIEWWRKFTLSAACFIFFFIGAPLGAIIRKGGLGMPVVISVLFFVMYYIISLFAEKFAREGQLSTAIGMWVSSIVLLPTGIYLTRKATRESTIFSIDRYLNVFKMIFDKDKKK